MLFFRRNLATHFVARKKNKTREHKTLKNIRLKENKPKKSVTAG